MHKKRIIPVYLGVVVLLMATGELIYSFRSNQPFQLRAVCSPATLSQILYMTSTLLLTRHMLLRFLLRKKYVQLFAGVLLVFTAFIFLRYFLEEVIFPQVFNFRNYPEGTRLGFYTLDNLNYGISYIILGIVFFFIEYQFDMQKKEQQLLQHSRDAELAFLRSQISPHFLFNSLNSIYSLSYKQSPKTTAAILQLSELVRYMLYEQKAEVPVAREWNYLLNYIALQELRYPYPLVKDITVAGDTDAITIPSFLLIPLVENAFKHGDFSSENYPLSIQLAITPGTLQFSISNHVSRQEKETGGGIGLDNIRRRLQLLYPGSHQFYSTTEKDIFTVYLHLKR